MSAVPVGRPGIRARGSEVRVVGVGLDREVAPGDDLAAAIAASLDRCGTELEPYDVVVVTHKVVSKAEGRIVALDSVTPSARAVEIAEQLPFDARHVEVILREAAAVVRTSPVLVCETRHGLVCANAGVDLSNSTESGTALLLPLDPDGSAARLRRAWLDRAGGGPLGVVVSDTFGRPFRMFGVNVAIGVAGMPALTPHAGERDATGYVVRNSEVATADEIASAAELVMGKVDGVPVAVVRGLIWTGDGTAAELVRPAADDLFRRPAARPPGAV